MRHQDGYCDGCGCEISWPGAQLTHDGRELCTGCTSGGVKAPTAKRPEARDDGR